MIQAFTQGIRMPPTHGSYSRQHGFTLVQMMIVVVILGVSSMMVAPNFVRVIASGKVNAFANELLATMHAARLEAMRTQKNSVVCPSTNGTRCGGSDWSTTIMFSDANGDNQVSSGERVSRVIRTGQADLVVRNQIGSGTARVVFRPNGIVQVGAGSSMDVASICAKSHPEQSRSLQVGTSMARTKIIHAQTAYNNEGCR